MIPTLRPFCLVFALVGCGNSVHAMAPSPPASAPPASAPPASNADYGYTFADDPMSLPCKTTAECSLISICGKCVAWGVGECREAGRGCPFVEACEGKLPLCDETHHCAVH